MLVLAVRVVETAGAGAGAVSWQCAWWRLGAGAGRWLCAWWRLGVVCLVPALVLVLGAGAGGVACIYEGVILDLFQR